MSTPYPIVRPHISSQKFWDDSNEMLQRYLLKVCRENFIPFEHRFLCKTRDTQVTYPSIHTHLARPQIVLC
jgi:hypothetical protein